MYKSVGNRRIFVQWRTISDVMVVQSVMRVHVSLLTINNFWSLYTEDDTHTHTRTHTNKHIHTHSHMSVSSAAIPLVAAISPSLSVTVQCLNKYKGSLCHAALVFRCVCVCVCVCVCERERDVSVGYNQCGCVISCVLSGLDPRSSHVSQLSLGLRALDGKSPPLPLCLAFVWNLQTTKQLFTIHNHPAVQTRRVFHYTRLAVKPVTICLTVFLPALLPEAPSVLLHCEYGSFYSMGCTSGVKHN